MAGEEAVNEADLVSDEEAESEADEAGSPAQVAADAGKVLLPISKRRADRERDQHHSQNGTNPEDREIRHCPAEVGNGGEHQQGNGSRSGKAMDDADDQWPEQLIHAAFLEPAVHGCHGIPLRIVRMTGGLRMLVRVNVVSV